MNQVTEKGAKVKTTQSGLPKSRQKELNQAIVDCVIDDMLPFTAFAKPGMLNLIKTFDARYQPPSRFTIASRVGNAYYTYIDQVKVSVRGSAENTSSERQLDESPQLDCPSSCKTSLR
jgi:hypothetical protein